MGKDIRVSRSPTPQLNELIKPAIGSRSLRQVEEESGISHGLPGKVINNTQKASVMQLTVPALQLTLPILHFTALYVAKDGLIR